MNAKLKTILNVTWKVGLGLFGLAAAAIGILIANVWHEETRGRNYRYNKNLSKDIAGRYGSPWPNCQTVTFSAIWKPSLPMP